MLDQELQETIEEAFIEGKEKFQTLGQKFLQWTPLNDIKWKDYLSGLTEEQQLQLLAHTVYTKENTKFPVARQYQKDKIKCVLLPWEDADDSILPSDFVPNILLAADVVYDPSVFRDLMHAIERLFKRNSYKSTLILGATVRNELTLNDFLELLASKCYVVREAHLDTVVKKRFIWDEEVPIKVYEMPK